MALPLPQEPSRLNGYHPPTPVEVPARRGFPLLHVILFLTTLVTTSMAGAFQQGADPFSDPTVLLLGLPFAATLMAILLFHEMGHYILARIHGIHATLPYFIPAPPPFVVVGTFGAFIRMKSPPSNRRALFDVGAAGPWAGVFLAIPAAMLGLSLSEVRPMTPFDEGGIILGDSFLFSILTRLVLGVATDEVSIVLHPIALAGWFGHISESAPGGATRRRACHVFALWSLAPLDLARIVGGNPAPGISRLGGMVCVGRLAVDAWRGSSAHA